MYPEALLHEGLVPTPGKRIRRGGLHALTGIRFFAAAWVMAFHFGAAFTARAHMPHPVTRFLEHGNLGVALFFMLSGFILYYTYQDNLETARDLYKFFVARLARLYPVYLLAVAIAVPLHGRLPHGRELLLFPLLQSWVPPVRDLGYTWIIQAWTLSVEAFFYCSFPFLLLPLRRLPRPALWTLAAGLFALNVGLRTPLLHPAVPATWPTQHLILPVLCLPEFMLGLALGALFLRRHTHTFSTPSNDWLTFAGIVPCCVVIGTHAGDFVIAFTAVLCFGWSIYRLADGRGWLTRLLSSPPMLLLGGASFSIYLMQSLVRETTRRLFANVHPGLDAALSPFLLIGLSCLIFLFYEEPMRGVIRTLLVRRRSPAKVTV